MDADHPSKAVVLQRVRNRVIEYLQMLCSYMVDPPPWNLNETLNQWQDWTDGPDKFPVPPYTENERGLLDDVQIAWDRFCDVTPKVITDPEAEKRRPEWAALQSTAEKALGELVRRGRMSESDEEQPPAVKGALNAV
jgi:hypothetical protein